MTKDEISRSLAMRELMISSSAGVSAADLPEVPRVLIQFWNTAIVPEDVRECLASWAALDALGFERLLFDDRSAGDFIQARFGASHVKAFGCCKHPAMRADFFRLCFMLDVGGVYVDADDVLQGGDIEGLVARRRLQLQPLCYDASTDAMVEPTLTLAKEQRDGLIFYVNNDPLIAGPGHPVVERALERATRALLDAHSGDRDVQALVGPGNLTASLVAHAVDRGRADGERDFDLLQGEWDAIAVSRWPLDYRADARNWRNWLRGQELQP